MKRWLFGLVCLLAPAFAHAQGSQFTAGPFNQGGFLYVCPVPSGGTPCPAPVALFSNITLATPIGNPIQMSAGSTVTFFAAGGQYTLQYPATGFSQVVGGGGSNSSSSAGLIDPTQAPYNVKADVGTLTGSNGSITNTLNTLSSATQSCTAGDVGKLAVVVNPALIAYPFGAGLVTVTGCSGNAWTLSATSVQTTATANFAIGSSGNGAGLAAAYAAALVARKILALPCGTMILDTPPFIGPTATYDWLTQEPDIQGCAATSGTKFIFHPNITAANGVLANGGSFFASMPGLTSVATGSVTYPGLGGQAKIENVLLTSLSGAIPGTGGKSYTLISTFNAVQNVQVFGMGMSAGTLTAIQNTSGENHHRLLNFQSFNTASGGYVGVAMSGQGPNTVFDSIFQGAGLSEAVDCAGGGTICELLDSFIVGTQQGVISSAGVGNQIVFVGNTCSVNGGGGSKGCLGDNGNATTFFVFGNPLISVGSAINFPAISITNSASVVDISGSNVSSVNSGYNVTGTGTLNDRAGNTWSSPLTQFTGKYVPIGGGSVATNSNSAATNFGANLGAQNIVTTSIAASTYDIKIGFRQSLLGVGCGAGSNTVNGVLSWTSGGAVQSTGAGGVPALPTLTISANGTVGTSSAYASVPVHADINTAISFTTTSVLASAGCGTVPQYVVDFSNI